ncbi:hypothetical protein ADIS_0778 [Lunatimonas lonarensis]|uniref:DUF3810 domain-containing protein n=1 Tax=Lunatimonas lonarensis TaxID=1232681 RepID=R7ZXJ5_9BACT|nr:DUF3810 domain-containing protein [Lunatimonas lonarensis]EON78881.1 hypothetical protein ADIS_0778 [Lunatimonas lonarensis]
MQHVPPPEGVGIRLTGNWTWSVLGVFALLIRYVAGRFPEGTEELYSRTIFPVIRNSLDATLSTLPFPTVYLFAASALAVLIHFFWLFFRRYRGWKDRSWYTVRSMCNGLGLLVFFFLVLWGFNYQRLPIFAQLDLRPVPLDEARLVEEMELTRNLLAQYRPYIRRDTAAIEETVDYPELEELVRREVGENLYLLGLNYSGKPRTRQFYPAGFMRHMGIYGIYFPFTGESYLDPSLHALEKPFTIAHEMAHSYGVTDEGEANFIAWVICTNSESMLLKYSGQLKLLRYQLNDLYRINPDSYRDFTATLPVGVVNDLASIRRNILSITPLFSEVSRKSNDLYLKTQGVKAGVQSYAQLPMLVYAWRNQLKGI